MSSLVQNILALEQEASAVVARAHEQATHLAKEADETIRSQRSAQLQESEKRVEEYRKSAAERFEIDKSEAEASHKAALAAIDQIPAARIQQQVDRIVNAFKGM
ncbi:MAG: hypothetical protein KJ060_02045 [Candidatus Hydrogenedentes bacterium]|nr:hypothetical protein [Candidatus Hydrogenedentota bacterium]